MVFIQARTRIKHRFLESKAFIWIQSDLTQKRIKPSLLLSTDEETNYPELNNACDLWMFFTDTFISTL